MRAVELGRRAVDLDPDRPGSGRAAAGAAARPGAVRSRAPARHGRVVRGRGRVQRAAGSVAMFDTKIEGATVIDGTGRQGSRTDIGIRDEMIVAVGDLSRERAGTVLNATGRTVTPGFIDMHSHSDWRLWGHRRAEP